jgi:DNA-directed RNA polymerase subunit RPC12/RpoP
MVNPGYKAKISEEPFNCDAGPMIKCPKCKKPLMEAIMDRLYMRCKHCGRWVFLQKIVDKTS